MLNFSILKKFQARRNFYRPSSARNSGNIAFLKIRYRSKFVQIWCLDGFWGLIGPRNVFFDRFWPVGIRVQIFDWSHISEYVGARSFAFLEVAHQTTLKMPLYTLQAYLSFFRDLGNHARKMMKYMGSSKSIKESEF